MLPGLTSDQDLLSYAEKLNIPINFIGSKDQLFNCKPRNGNYIINMQDSTQGRGSHWVGFVINGNSCYYMDSFAVVPPIEVMNFCKDKKIYYNKSQIQGLRDDFCGEFVIDFLKNMNKSKNKAYLNFSNFIDNYNSLN